MATLREKYGKRLTPEAAYTPSRSDNKFKQKFRIALAQISQYYPGGFVSEVSGKCI